MKAVRLKKNEIIGRPMTNKTSKMNFAIDKIVDGLAELDRLHHTFDAALKIYDSLALQKKKLYIVDFAKLLEQIQTKMNTIKDDVFNGINVG